MSLKRIAIATAMASAALFVLGTPATVQAQTIQATNCTVDIFCIETDDRSALSEIRSECRGTANGLGFSTGILLKAVIDMNVGPPESDADGVRCPDALPDRPCPSVEFITFYDCIGSNGPPPPR